MSVRAISKVWDHSTHSGTELLMLLAIADFSDDDGFSYPSVDRLAQKCRMQPRNARYILQKLQDSGELEAQVNAGPHGTNRYRIVFSAFVGVQGSAGVQSSAGVQWVAGVQGASPLQPIAGAPATHCRGPLQPIAAEPSLNRKEPSGTSATKGKPNLPNCPYDLIVQLYHDTLPKERFPRVRLLDDSRKTVIRKFWEWVMTSTKASGEPRAQTPEQAQAWVRGYFERTLANDFLMGRTPQTEQHRNWKPDIEYLLKPAGVKQVLEKTAETTT